MGVGRLYEVFARSSREEPLPGPGGLVFRQRLFDETQAVLGEVGAGTLEVAGRLGNRSHSAPAEVGRAALGHGGDALLEVGRALEALLLGLLSIGGGPNPRG